MIQRLVIVLTVVGLAHHKSQNLTCDEIKKFVDGHNVRRLQVAKEELKGQPGAYAMKSVIWDEELAAKADQWASANELFHNLDRKIASKRFKTGENMFWSASLGPSDKVDPDTALSSWFEEHENYKYDTFSSRSKKSGHYTQMVWSDSIYIGCAISKEVVLMMTKVTVVCNYGPAGNINGRAPYKKRTGGSQNLVCGAANCSKPYGDKCGKNFLRLSFDLRIFA